MPSSVVAPPPAAQTLTGDLAKLFRSDAPGFYKINNVNGVYNYAQRGPSADAQDVLTGSGVADSISGAGGADALFGQGGNDVIDGGAGDDVILGGSGADTLSGSSGRDVIFGSGLGSLTTFASSPTALQPTAEGTVFTRGWGWVTSNAGLDANGVLNLKVKGFTPHPDTEDAGNVIDAGADDDWVAANQSVFALAA